MTTSLFELTAQIQQHDAQIAHLRKQAEELRKQERSGIIQELRKKIAEYDLTAADLKLTRKAGTRVSSAPKGEAKYRSPTGETWSGGRGRKPGWVTAVLAAGKSLSDFEIK